MLGLAVGSACALFLWLLDRVTSLRWEHGWLLFLLPAAGMVVAALYRRVGHGVGGGNNLIVDEIHEPGAGGGGVPARLAPLVLIGTILTHLCGGSAGREGTAVQMGGSLAGALSRLVKRCLRLDDADTTRSLLMAGVAAGFGGVFGTPLAGAVFALEVPALGRMSYAAAVPSLIAAVVADRTCAMWGIHHTQYSGLVGGAGIASVAGSSFDWGLLGIVALGGAIFGLAARVFSEATHSASAAFRFAIPAAIARPAVGGVLVIALTWLTGTRDFLGLGVTSPDPHAVTIVSAFSAGGASWSSWWLKIVFTALTLGAGFKGGEVTPLFFVGATLGNALAPVFGVPVPFMASLGFVAVFAGATNTPLACTLMAVELFGAHDALYYATACFMAYLWSGHSGIYLSQRVATPKLRGADVLQGASLREIRAHASIVRPGHLPIQVPYQASIPRAGATGMTDETFHLQERDLGQLRIYLRAGARGSQRPGWRRLLGRRPLYVELIESAKAAGIAHATSHHTRHGYSGAQAIQSDFGEVPNGQLTVYVELTDERMRLEDYCRTHGEDLAGLTMIFKHVESWDVAGSARPGGVTAKST